MITNEHSIAETLEALFAAEREARGLHDALADRADEERDELLAGLRSAVAEAADLDDEDEASLRLVCAARLLGELDGAEVVDSLIDILDVDFPEGRNEAGEQLQGLAFERFKEVAQGVERALERLGRGSPALVELPYILVEIPEGGVQPLLGRFLDHPDPDAVAAAIEALVELGDPAAAKLLAKLVGDKRVSAVGDEDLQAEVTVGELAAEAIELFGRMEDE